MITVFCIDCDRPIRLDSRPRQGERIFCSSCGTELEVVGLDPVQLDWVSLEPAEEQADWRWWLEGAP